MKKVNWRTIYKNRKATLKDLDNTLKALNIDLTGWNPDIDVKDEKAFKAMNELGLEKWRTA